MFKSSRGRAIDLDFFCSVKYDLKKLEEDFEMEDKNARIAEIKSQIKQLQSELAELRKDQSTNDQSKSEPIDSTVDFLHSQIFEELWDEISRGEWEPGGKHWKNC